MLTKTRGLLLASAMTALLAAPAISAAQTRCEQQAQNKKVEGTVIGGVLGALAGNAIGRGGGRTGGTIIGGVAGAAVGNNLSRTHCPDGYAEVQDPNYIPPPPPVEYGTNYAPPPPPQAYWRSAPSSLHERFDWLQARIDRSRSDGTISPREADYGQRELGDIRRMAQELRDRDGGELNEADRAYVQSRLDTLSQRLRWESQG
jgi:uncharacterized membrane protein YebE (DUF533 family)